MIGIVFDRIRKTGCNTEGLNYILILMNNIKGENGEVCKKCGLTEVNYVDVETYLKTYLKIQCQKSQGRMTKDFSCKQNQKLEMIIIFLNLSSVYFSFFLKKLKKSTTSNLSVLMNTVPLKDGTTYSICTCTCTHEQE